MATNFSCLTPEERQECEAWVKDMADQIYAKTGQLSAWIHSQLRETWANGFLAGKQTYGLPED